MFKLYRNIFLLLALTVSVGVMAQNMTSSPFSRYAYGDMNENVPAAYRAMGGVGFGMRSNKAINPSQPSTFLSTPGKYVKHLFRSFGNCSNLKSVKIPYGVVSIGELAFDHCEELTSI